MNDAPLLTALAGLKAGIGRLEADLKTATARPDTEQKQLRANQDAMMARMDDQSEAIIEQVGSLKSDFQHTKGFLPEDAVVLGSRMLAVEERLSRLERKQS